MENQREIFLQMVGKQVESIKYLHSVGDGNRFGVIYITHDDEAFGVGYNGDYNLLCGRGENFLVKTIRKPEKIPELSGRGIWRVHIGDHRGLALGEHGIMYVWGLTFVKIRSCYDVSNIHLPRVMNSAPGVVSYVAGGGGYFVAITVDKKLFMWGHIDWSAPYSDGRLFSPMHKEVKHVACGAWHINMLTTDGKVYTCGHGGYGQLGYDWTEDDGFWKVEKLTSITEPCIMVDAGSASSMFLTQSGELWACGLNHPQQFGGLGVDNETTTITTPSRVQIKEPITSVCCSWTLNNLRNVYGAKTKDGNKIYVWGWGFESKHPQPYERAISLKDVFQFKATAGNLGDTFELSKKHEPETICSPLQIKDSSADKTDLQDMKPLHEKKHDVPSEPYLKRKPSTKSLNTDLHQLNNFNIKITGTNNKHSSDGNKLYPTKTPSPHVSKRSCNCIKNPYKLYLDYVYSGGGVRLEFGELVEVYLLAVEYEENQLQEYTFEEIKNRLNESNFPVLLECAQTHQSIVLKELGELFIKNLCKEPQKVADLIMNLKLSEK
ncbi:hypothetical protein GE061_009290 [Apolygus lucorum]|uniref:Uncharacterized protein n=1 Tax=Apolygus lucorum TaxID=248454 RepID=A0A8S9Y036_APOLU|nr:hypothetical protein GE061_009290 [Apolygus lucorum]